MKDSGNYIGTPCAVVLCVNSYGQKLCGNLYHAYRRDGIPFSGVEKVFLEMEDFYNQLQFPFPGTEDRSFLKEKTQRRKERMVRVMKDEELLKRHGDLGTFIIRVQHRQHSSWQGVATWTDKQKTVPFRSALELMKLIDGALASEAEDEDKASLTEDGERRNYG